MAPAFPALKGQGWSVTKRPTFSTRRTEHVSGREVRTPFFSYPLYEYELTFDGLDSDGSFPGLGANSLQSLMGLYLQCQGSYGTFLYNDPTDNAVIAQPFGTGNGLATAFQLVRTLGGATGPIYAPATVQVYKTDWQGVQLQYTTPRTNLLPRSEEIDTSVWTKGNVAISANATTAPSGPSTADKVAETSATGSHYVLRTNASQVSGTVLTFSIYAKAVERTAVSLQSYNGSNFAVCHFNLATGTGSPGSGISAYSITNMGSGWYRLSITFTMATTSSPSVYVLLANSAGNVSYAGTIGSGAYIWGAQMETGSLATSYIATAAAAVTVTDYSLGGTGVVTFSAAPASGVSLTWTGTYNWLCRFLDDQVDFENFMSGLWKVEGLKFRSVKA